MRFPHAGGLSNVTVYIFVTRTIRHFPSPVFCQSQSENRIYIWGQTKVVFNVNLANKVLEGHKFSMKTIHSILL
jgi:hypothetical protein